MASVLARLKADDALDVLVAEEEHFSATHQDFGAGLARHWNLPSSLTFVTGCHHCPLESPERERSLVTMVYVAERLVAGCQPRFPFDPPFTDIGDDALDQLHLTRGQVNTIAADLRVAVEEVNAFLSGE